MVGTKFKCPSGNISEWIVLSPHHMFPDTWKCYALDKYVPDVPLKESFIQHFSTDFINERKYDETEQK